MEVDGLQSDFPQGIVHELKATTWRDLPDHLLEAIGSHIYGNDYLTARLVCHVWRRALSPVTRTVKVHLHHRRLDPGARLHAVQEAFPRACRMAIYVDANTERGGVDLTAACCATLNAMADTTAQDPPAYHSYQSNQRQLPERKQRQLEQNTNNAVAWESSTTAAPDVPPVNYNVQSCGSNGGCPGPPDVSNSGVGVDTTCGSSMNDKGSGNFSDNKGSDSVCSGKLIWQFMSVTVGASVLPLNRDQLDPTTHRLMSNCQWVGQQLGAAFAASRPALRCLRHLTTMELTSDTALFAGLLPHLARTGSAPSLSELRFTRAEASRGSLGRWLAVAGPQAAGRRGSGEEMVAALDALGDLTGLRALALNAGLPGIPTSVSRLSNLSSLELHHGGRGVAMVEDVAPLAMLTGLTSLKLRYVALRHTWQLTRLTALTSLDLTLRAFYSSEGGADGEEDLDDLDDLDAVMEDDWFAPPAPAVLAPAGGNNEGQVAATAEAAAVPGGPPADGIARVVIEPAARPPQQQPHFEFIPAPAYSLQYPPQPHPQYGLTLTPPQQPAGAVGMQPPTHLTPSNILNISLPTSAAAQGPSSSLPRQEVPAQPQRLSHQPADQAGRTGSGHMTAAPGASLHPHPHVSWGNPNLALLLHPHLPRPQNHTQDHCSDQSQPEQQQETTQPEQPDLQQEPPPQQDGQPSNVYQQFPQQQGLLELQQCRCAGSDYRQHDQQGTLGAKLLGTISPGDLELQLPTGTRASGSPGIYSPVFCNTAQCTTPTVAVTPTLVARASTSTTFVEGSQSAMQLAPQNAVGASACGKNDGSDDVNSVVVTYLKPAQEPGIGHVTGALGGDDSSGRRPGCSHGGNDVAARSAGGSAKHHGGFGSWMFGDSGRESDSDGAVTFSLASSAAGSDWFVEDDGAGRDGGGGSGSINVVAVERHSRRVAADDGRITFHNMSASDGTAGGVGVGSSYGNGGVSTALVLRSEPSVHSDPSAQECLAFSASLPTTTAHDGSHVLAPAVAISVVASEDAPLGAPGEPHIASSTVQLPAFAGPFGSSWGSGSSNHSSCRGSGSGDGAVAAGLGSVDVAEVPHTSRQAEGAHTTGDKAGAYPVASDTAAQILKVGQLEPVSTDTPRVPMHTPEDIVMEVYDQAGAGGVLDIATPVAVAAAAAANAANVAAAAAAAAFAAFAGGNPGEVENGDHGPQAVGNDQLEVEEWPPIGADADGLEAENEDDANGDDELAEAELILAAAHDAAVSRELWRAVGALPGLKALNVNAWHEAPLDDERLGELAKLSLPPNGQLPVPGLTSLGLLLQASSASSRLSSLSDLTGLKDLTLVVAPPKGNGGRQPPPAAASVHLSALDFDYDSDEDLNEHPDELAPSAGDGGAGLCPSSVAQGDSAIAARPHSDTNLMAKLTGIAESGSSPSLPVVPSRIECATVGAVDADGDVQMGEQSGHAEQNSNFESTVGHGTANAGVSTRDDGSAPPASGGGVGIVNVGSTTALPSVAAEVAGKCRSPVCHLASLTLLERLRLYDDPGALPVDQESAKLLSRAWSRMNDIYILGSITLLRSCGLMFGRLAHLDLFNQTSGVPYRLQLHHLPPSMRALGVQNAVLEGANRASQLQSVLEGLSLYATVHWSARANGGIDMYDWIAGCCKLASLTIEYDMRTFANIMNGTAAAAGTGAAITTLAAVADTTDAMGTSAGGETSRAPAAALDSSAAAAALRPGHGLSGMPLVADISGQCLPLAYTPLRRLARLPALATLGVFFADSHQELMAGVLDQRLVDDVAELAFLEELEIWNVYGTDWSFQTDFSSLARLSRLRSLKMEALPPFMAFRIRRTMQEGVPYCKLRLVADNEMVPVGPPAIAAGGLAL